MPQGVQVQILFRAPDHDNFNFFAQRATFYCRAKLENKKYERAICPLKAGEAQNTRYYVVFVGFVRVFHSTKCHS